MPEEDGVELKSEDIDRLINEAAENFAYAAQEAGGAMLQPASYNPADNSQSPSHPNLTVIHKRMGEAEAAEQDLASILEGSEVKTVKVGRGDTLMSLILKVGGEASMAKSIVEAMEPSFGAKDLKPGQQIRFNLIPAPSDTEEMEPLRVSVFDSKDNHIATVARNVEGEFAVTNEAGLVDAAKIQGPQRATLYTSFYHAALNQRLSPDTILKLLRVHSYDVDFKRRVSPGDSFDVFFDVPADSENRDELGEMLYTSMTIDGSARSFWRFRTPDGIIDYYDEHGNSAKKFLMRNPVRGGRYTSGYGTRRHPLLRVTRMHTGVDWAAPSGTPIVAAADGTVERVGRQGGYGNYIRIRHANGFTTAYGHLSRYADGLEPSISVKQGQVIGYVGSTGFSTGPHCHYEIMVNNKFVNPMTIQVPRGLQLTGKQIAAFNKERKRIDTLRQMDPVTTNRVAQASQTTAASQ